MFSHKEGVDNIDENLNVYKGVVRQYLDTKVNHKNELLLFQIGNFYVSFFTDALIMSSLAYLKVTSYGKHDVDWSGFPVSSLEKYETILKDNQFSYVIYTEISEINNKDSLKSRRVFKIENLKKTPDDFKLEEKEVEKIDDIQDINKFLKNLNLSNITPIEALNLLSELKCKLNH